MEALLGVVPSRSLVPIQDIPRSGLVGPRLQRHLRSRLRTLVTCGLAMHERELPLVTASPGVGHVTDKLGETTAATGAAFGLVYPGKRLQ